MSLIQEYLAMEEHSEAPDVNVEVEVEVEVPEVQDVSEDEVYEADEHLEHESVSRVEEEHDLRSAEAALEEIDTQVASLENYIDVLEHGIEATQYSPQFAAMVQSSMEEHAELFGEGGPAVSLESYGHDNLGEYYQAALEGFKEQLIKYEQLRERILKGVYNKVANTAVIAKRNSIAKSLQQKADAGLNQLASVSNSGKVEISLKGLKGRIAVNGAVPTNIAAAIKKDQAAMNELLKNYAPSALAYMKEAKGAAKDAIDKLKSKDKESGKNGLEVFAQRELPETKLSAGILDGSALIGNTQLKFEKVEKGGDAASRLKAISKRSKAKFVSSGGTPSGSDTISMTKADAIAILNAVKVYASIIEQGNKSVTQLMKGIRTEGQLDYRYLINQGDYYMKLFNRNKELTQLAKVTRTYPKFITRIINGAFGHSVDSAKAGLQVAERITKALGKGGKEEKKDDE